MPAVQLTDDELRAAARFALDLGVSFRSACEAMRRRGDTFKTSRFLELWQAEQGKRDGAAA